MAVNSPSKMLKFRNLLWKLHYKLEKQDAYTSFDKLTDDPRYRAHILASMHNHENADLSELVAKIIEQEKLLGIHYELDENDITPLPTTKIKPNNIAEPQQANRTTGFKYAGLFLVLAFITVIAYSLNSSYSSITSISAEDKIAPSMQKVLQDNTVLTSVVAKTPLSASTLSTIMAPIDTSSTQAPEKTTILRIHGSNTVGEKLAPALIESYLKSLDAQHIQTIVSNEVEKSVQAYLPEQGWIDIEILAHGSSTSFAGMDNGSADMGMASRKIKDQEVALLKERFGDLTRPNSEHILGLDGLAIIVNKANPINHLNTQQLAGLFSGEITNWSEIGGDDLAVSIYSRDDNSGTWDTFKNLVLSKYNKKLSKNASRYESSSELSDLVSQDSGAIGFIGLPYVRHSKLLAVADGQETQSIIPTLFTVGTEDYPLSRRLYFYTPAQQSTFMRDFIEYTMSDQGQDVVKENGFISQNLYTVTPSISEELPVDYQQLVNNAERLSLNFRFQTGSDVLDNKSLRDLKRLTDYLANNPSRKLRLLGFSDNIGNEAFNILLSEQRAKKIESELQRRGIFPTIVKGLGKIMPIASNTTKAGRDKNRRVEIWING